MNQENISKPKLTVIIFTILGLFPLIGMGVDLIAPSLPMIANNLQASDHFSKNLITIFLLGIIIGNFTIGLTSDSFGRRRFLLGALIVFILASLLPTFVPEQSMLMISRFLQGASLAFYLTLSRAILSDSLTHEHLMRVVPLTATLWGIGPIIGPFIGGYLQYYFNWQACFYFYAAYGFIGLIIFLFFLPETHFKRHPLNIKQLIKNYKEILSHHTFLGFVAMMGFTYSLLIVFNNFGPFFIQNSLGFSSIAFGKMALACGVIFLLGTLICRYLLKEFNSKLVIQYTLPPALFLMVVATIILYSIGSHIIIILTATFIGFFVCGILYPAAMAGAMLLFRHLAGSAGATMSLINISITCIASLVISFFNTSSAMPLLFTFVILLCLNLIIYKCVLKTHA